MHINTEIPLYLIIPFVLMLLSIAILPIITKRFWEENKNKLLVAIVLSLPIIGFLLYNNMAEVLEHTILFDYIPFIILLGSLYVITGGIYLTGDIIASPRINTIFLFAGVVLASFMGTTGAAMLLLRPVISTNKERKFKVHTILFYIALVANCGGLLTPLGDPPLFMMYLRGAPFLWFIHFVPEWLTVNIILLTVYYFVDRHFYKKEAKSDIVIDIKSQRKLKLQGSINFIFLAGVILSVAFINEQYFPSFATQPYFKFIREFVLLFLTALSLLFTPKLLRVSNNFTWEPIKEVAYLFIGIFLTMIPAILYLQNNASTLGIDSPKQFYYLSGALSSFLDNTPTALTFHSLALGLGLKSHSMVAGIPEIYIYAICLGSVFFGSMTYIGNGPNFMIKSIAEENNIKMPHFFEYMIKFSLIILLPVFILIQLIFI